MHTARISHIKFVQSKLGCLRLITNITKNWIIVLCNSRDLIGSAAMVYKPLYHAQEIETIKLSSGCKI